MNEKTMREALEDAYDADPAVEEESTDEPIIAKSDESVIASKDEEEGIPSEETPGSEPTEAVSEDDAGTTEPVTAEVSGEEAPEGAVLAEGLEQAPASWRPGAREHWAGLPAAIKEEIHRREQSATLNMQEAATNRKFATEFNELVHPYMPLIESQGGTPMTAVKNFFATSAGLTLGTAAQKAQIVSNIISQYGVSVQELDTILSGQIDPNGEGAPNVELSRMLDERFAPIQNFMSEVSTARSTAANASKTNMSSELDTFSTSHEFFEDVRMDMADLMDIASGRGETLSLDAAYERALRMNDSVSAVIADRRKAADAGITNEEMSDKEKAASSISGTELDPAAVKDSRTVRGALEAAWDEAS